MYSKDPSKGALGLVTTDTLLLTLTPGDVLNKVWPLLIK